MGLLSDGRWEWKIQWRRHFFDHEIDMVAAFMVDIEAVQIHPSSQDYLSWGGILLVTIPQSLPTISFKMRVILLRKTALPRSFGD